MDSNENNFADRVASFREAIQAENLTLDQLLDRCANLQVATAIGAESIKALLAILHDLRVATEAASMAENFSSRLGEAIAFRDVPPYLIELITAGKRLQATQATHANRATGSRGASRKHAKTDALKAWAIKQAADRKGDDRSIAKSLASELPQDLLSASKDAERLIYDALRAHRKGASRHARTA